MVGGTSIVGVPDEIVRMYRMQIEERRSEQARVNALSPEARQRELDAALHEASQVPRLHRLATTLSKPRSHDVRGTEPVGSHLREKQRATF